METPLLFMLLGLLLASQALGQTWVQYGGHEYHFASLSPDLTTWHYARSRCQGYGGDLVSITNDAEHDFIYAETQKLEQEGYIWIGLNYLDRTAWKWSDGESVVPDYWADGLPSENDDKGVLKLCVNQPTHELDGVWYNTHCDENRGYMCKRVTGDTEPKTDVPTQAVDGYCEGTCPVGWIFYANNCYYFEPNIETDWKSAVSECSSLSDNKAYLASIHNELEGQFIHVEMAARNKKPVVANYWIGLTKDGPLSNANAFYWLDNTPIDYTFWGSGEPSDDLGQEDCVEVWINVNTWNDIGCSENNLKSFTCKMPMIPPRTPPTHPPPGAGTCPADWVLYANNCYYFEPNIETDWKGAVSECSSLSDNKAYLASIHSELEGQFMHVEMAARNQKPKVANYWIGLKKDGPINANAFYWLDNTPIDYTFWGSDEPSDAGGKEDCVEVWINVNTWNDIGCSDNNIKSFICKMPMTPQASGPKWVQYGGHEYHFASLSPDLTTWHYARSRCQGYGGDLVSITNDAEHDFIYAETQKLELAGYIWIGLNYLDRTAWKWSDGESVVLDYWADGLPSENDDKGVLKLCVNQPTHELDGVWYNSHCDENRGYMCKRVTGDTEHKTNVPTQAVDGYCPTGYFGVGAGNKCLKIETGDQDRQLTWDQAVVECRNGPGYIPDIASIYNEYETALITSQIRGHTVGLWSGLHRDQGDNRWKWVDNTPIRYTKWAPGRPNSNADCAYVTDRGDWDDWSCTAYKGYICQTYKSANDIVPTPNPTTPNQCRSDYTPYWYGCYKVLSDTYDWKEAQTKCETDIENGNLVSMHSIQENYAIFSKVMELDTSIWIGLVDDKGQGEYTWTDTWHVIYTNWGQGQPHREQGGGCVAMKTHDGGWYDTTCTTKMKAICKVALVDPMTTPAHLEGTCPGAEDGLPSDKRWWSYGEYCYYFEIQTTRKWAQANEYCHHKSAAGKFSTLVSVHNYFENEFLADTLRTFYGVRHLWIGMYRQKNDRTFAWADGSTIQYTNWAPGEPNGNTTNENCVDYAFQDSYTTTWRDVNCNEYRNIICKAPKLPHPTPPTPPTHPPTAAGTCPAGWVHYVNNCYYFQPNTYTDWKGAVSDCSSLSDNKAYLASIHNELEGQFMHVEMAAHNQLPKVANYWIGLKKNGSLNANAFYWLDNTPIDYTFWGSGEPSDHGGTEDCVEVWIDVNTWNDIRCTDNNLKSFICKMPMTSLQQEEEDNSLAAGTIVGIAFGVLIGLILISVSIVLFLDYFSYIDISKQTADAKAFFGFSNINYEKEDDPIALGVTATDAEA